MRSLTSLKSVFTRRPILWAGYGHGHRFWSASAIENSNLPLPEPNLDDIKAQFRKHEGGQFTLTRDNSTGIASLCIEHPENKNSLSGKMMVELNDAVRELEKWNEGKGLVLHSVGDTFCSGGYLGTVKKIQRPVDGFMVAYLMHDSVIRLRNLHLVSVAVVQGKALGGGSELLLSTDFRLFTKETEVAYVQAKMGLTTGWGGGIFLKNLLGHPKALDLLLTGRKVKIDEALSIGLADGTVNNENRLQEATTWLNSKIQHLPLSLVHATKKNINCKNHAEERQILATVWGGKAQENMLAKNFKHK